MALVNIVSILCLLLPLAYSAVPTFSQPQVVGTIDNSALNDASGLAASRKFPGILYAHNDHGDRPRIFAINASNAHVVAEFTISPAQHTDWEDMSVGPCGPADKRSCIYISDDGEYQHSDEKTIYRVPEPDTMTNQTLAPDSVLKFNWTETGSKTLMVDPEANVYIISEMLGGRGMIVNLPASAWGQTSPVFVESGAHLGVDSTHHDPQAGDISPDGTSVLVMTRNDLYYWSVTDGNYLEALVHKGEFMPTYADHNGEGLCFSADGNAFYTIAEGSSQPLYKYTLLSA